VLVQFVFLLIGYTQKENKMPAKHKEKRKAKLIPSREKEVKRIFHQHDADGSGFIDHKELIDAMHELKVDCTKDELAALIKEVDMDGNGKLDFEEFKMLFCEGRLRNVFNQIDLDKSGFIVESELNHAMKNLGYKLNKTAIKRLLNKVDMNSDGKVSFDEFKIFFHLVPAISLASLAAKLHKPVINDKKEKEITEIFYKHDLDKSGTIDTNELTHAFKVLKLNVSQSDIKNLMEEIDVDGNGKLDLDEFKLMFCEGRLRSVFNQFDLDKSGYIIDKELQIVMKNLDYNLNARSIRRLLNKVDTNRDGKVSFDEFKEFFRLVPAVSIAAIASRWMDDTSIDVGTDIAPAITSEGAPWYYGFFGGIGGIVSRTVTAPLEKIKIQAQTSSKSVSIFSELSKTIKNHGIRGLFAGNLANCLRVFPMATIVNYTYMNGLQFTPVDAELDPMEPVYRGSVAALAGIVAQTLTYPIDVIRARLSTFDSGHSVTQCARDIIKESGYKGLYKGLYPTLFAVAPFLACQYAAADSFKILSADYEIPLTTPVMLGITGTAGIMAQTIVYPLDVIRRRMQVSVTGSAANTANETVLADKTWVAMRQVVQREGFKSLFAGIIPTYLKVFPSVAIAMTTTKTLIGAHKEWGHQYF
jgi:solute carrier family 25 (mitochondrial phosphate transporter), member 23/24/25/41